MYIFHYMLMREAHESSSAHKPKTTSLLRSKTLFISPYKNWFSCISLKRLYIENWEKTWLLRVYFSLKDFHAPGMDILRSRLLSWRRTGSKTSLAVNVTKMKHQNKFQYNWSIFLGPLKKVCILLLKMYMNRASKSFPQIDRRNPLISSI